MGGDGGSYTKNRRFIRSCTENDSDKRIRNKKNNMYERATTCALSLDSLSDREPLVCCELGRIYIKECLIAALLDENKKGQGVISHIRSLKDVRTLKLCKNTIINSKSITNNSNYVNNNNSNNGDYKYICPILKTAFNGTVPFVVIWSTGHVLSLKALKQMGGANLQEEYGPFVEDDVIPLLTVEDDSYNNNNSNSNNVKIQIGQNQEIYSDSKTVFQTQYDAMMLRRKKIKDAKGAKVERNDKKGKKKGRETSTPTTTTSSGSSSRSSNHKDIPEPKKIKHKVSSSTCVALAQQVKAQVQQQQQHNGGSDVLRKIFH